MALHNIEIAVEYPTIRSPLEIENSSGPSVIVTEPLLRSHAAALRAIPAVSQARPGSILNATTHRQKSPPGPQPGTAPPHKTIPRRGLYTGTVTPSRRSWRSGPGYLILPENPGCLTRKFARPRPRSSRPSRLRVSFSVRGGKRVSREEREAGKDG
jgi:hypothetical protein